MDLVADEGIALFAGLNVVPKRSYLAAYSSSVDDRTIERLMAAWFNETPRAGLTHGASLDLDFHTRAGQQHRKNPWKNTTFPVVHAVNRAS